MRKTIACVFVLMAAGTAVLAQQGDPIRQRQALMKNNQDQVRALTAMARGQTAFDQATAQRGLQAIEQNARQIPALFPPNSTQGDTRALPAIWERKSDFDARAMKLAQDSNAAQTMARDPASLQTQLQAIGQVCGGCHEMYRRRTDG